MHISSAASSEESSDWKSFSPRPWVEQSSQFPRIQLSASEHEYSSTSSCTLVGIFLFCMLLVILLPSNTCFRMSHIDTNIVESLYYKYTVYFFSKTCRITKMEAFFRRLLQKSHLHPTNSH